MPIYTFHVFNANGQCLYKREPFRDTSHLEAHDEQYHSIMKSFQALASAFAASGGNNIMLGFRTNKYRVHHLESLTGYSFVVCTDVLTPDLRPKLADFYANAFVEYVIRDPTYAVGVGKAQSITSPLFVEAVDAFIRAGIPGR